MVSEQELTQGYVDKDPSALGVLREDRPRHVWTDASGYVHETISSPFFRDLYYVRGYLDGINTGFTRGDKGTHPANEEAYWLGWDDAMGDLMTKL